MPVLNLSGRPTQTASGQSRVWRIAYLVIGVSLFAIALTFANQEPYRTAGSTQWPAGLQPPVQSIAANALAGFAALGFAIAGGLAIVASAIGGNSGHQV